MTLLLAGETAKVKLDGAAIPRLALEVALCVPTVTVTGPVAAPAGMTKEMAVAVNVAVGAAMVPPPCMLSVT